jgi:hypothetical protein
VKNVYFHWKVVTSSNFFKIIKTATILIKLGTNVDWTSAVVTTCSVLNFLIPRQRVDISKLPKNHYFELVFSIKIDFNISLDWDRIKGFSALVTCCIMIELGSFLASYKSRKFLAMRGGCRPFQTPKQKGAHPPSGNPLISFR